MLQKNDIGNSILEVFQNMKIGVPYRLNKEALENLNSVRAQKGYSIIKPFSFQSNGKELVVSWLDNGWAVSRIDISNEDTQSLAFSFVVGSGSRVAVVAVAFAFSFAENQIELVTKATTLDGKIVLDEETGLKYKMSVIE